MRILVTGGAGFIGSNIVDACIQAGHKVSIIDNLSTGREKNINPKAVFIRMDICSDDVGRVFAEGRFDAVSHHAAQIDVRKSVADPVFDATVNITGTINLLQNCVEYGVRHFVFASTGGAIYGEQDVFPADESHPTRPLSPYGIAKLAGEKYLYFYKTSYGLNYTALRYANVYGPRQDPHGEAGVVAIFTQKFLEGSQPVINGDGLQTRDFVYVGDVVKANLLAISNKAEGVFNIGTGKEVSILEMFRQLAKAAGNSAVEKFGPAKSGEQKRSVIDYRLANKILGWSPSVSLDQGLLKTVEYFRANR